MIIEARKCVCGLDMVESKGVYRCITADGVQPQETQINPKTGEAYERIPSGWDEDHNKDWERKQREWYPEQYKGRKGGTS